MDNPWEKMVFQTLRDSKTNEKNFFFFCTLSKFYFRVCCRYSGLGKCFLKAVDFIGFIKVLKWQGIKYLGNFISVQNVTGKYH